jgi:uncharacterized membrane protein YsdA (DUF1294 family)
MAEDKSQAQRQEKPAKRERISEKTLHEVALLGGFPGITMGAWMFNHKVSKQSFWPPVVLSIIIWMVFLALLASGALSRALPGA